MLIIGLTGSIGMGKSTAAARFRARGIAVFDADAEVHKLYDGPLAAEINVVFPGTMAHGRVDRARLSHMLIANPERFAELEALVHPRVSSEERRFLDDEAKRGARMAVLEIPLLLEKGSEDLVDVVVVVSADISTQQRRVLERPGMTPAKLAAVLARQIPDSEKRRRADFVVDTSGPVTSCNDQIDDIIAKLGDQRGVAYERVWKA